MKKYVPFILICLLTLPMWLYLASLKDIWFCDEVYSIECANSGIFYYLNPLDEAGKWMRGSDIADYLSKGEKLFNFIEIEKYLYTDHVPVYFLLLRVFSLLAYGTVSKWIGLSLNLLAYVTAAFLLFRFFCRYLENQSLAALASCVLLLHPIFLSEATMIRMYMLLTTEALLFLHLAREEVFCSPKPERSTFRNVFPPLFLSIFTAFGLLTHYYFWFFVLSYSFVYGIFWVIQKKWRVLFRYIGTMLFSLVLATAGFPLLWKRTLLAKGENTQALHSLAAFLNFGQLKERMGMLFKSFGEEVFPQSTTDSSAGVLKAGIVILLIFLAFLFFFFSLRKTNSENASDRNKLCELLLLFLSALLDLVLISWITVNLSVRYLWTPMLLVMMVILLCFCIFCERVLCKKVPLALLPNCFAIYELMRPNGRNFLWNKKRAAARGRFLSCSILVCFFSGSLLLSLQTDNIDWLRARTPQEKKAIEQIAAGKTWIIFADQVDWQLHCSFYDFRLAGDLVRITSEEERAAQNAEYADTDEILSGSDTVIFYTYASKNVEECIAYVERVTRKKIRECKKIARSASMEVYCVKYDAN